MHVLYHVSDVVKYEGFALEAAGLFLYFRRGGIQEGPRYITGHACVSPEIRGTWAGSHKSRGLSLIHRVAIIIPEPNEDHGKLRIVGPGREIFRHYPLGMSAK